MREADSPCMQSLSAKASEHLDRKGSISGRQLRQPARSAAIQRIAENGKTSAAAMNADLVRPAGLGHELDKRYAGPGCEQAEFGAG